MSEGPLGNIRAFLLSDAEVLLLEHTEQEFATLTQAAKAQHDRRVAAILRAHGLPPDTVGNFQADPLNPREVRFLYREDIPVNPMLALPAGDG